MSRKDDLEDGLAGALEDGRADESDIGVQYGLEKKPNDLLKISWKRD